MAGGGARGLASAPGDAVIAATARVRRVRAWHRGGLKRLVRAPEAGASGFRSARRAPADGRGRHREGPTEAGAATRMFRPRGTRQGHRAFRRNDGCQPLSRQGRGRGRSGPRTLPRRDGAFPGLQGTGAPQGGAGDGFACGIVLHDGGRIEQAAPGLFAMPFRMLWEGRGGGRLRIRLRSDRPLRVPVVRRGGSPTGPGRRPYRRTIAARKTVLITEQPSITAAIGSGVPSWSRPTHSPAAAPQP